MIRPMTSRQSAPPTQTLYFERTFIFFPGRAYFRRSRETLLSVPSLIHGSTGPWFPCDGRAYGARTQAARNSSVGLPTLRTSVISGAIMLALFRQNVPVTTGNVCENQAKAYRRRGSIHCLYLPFFVDSDLNSPGQPSRRPTDSSLAMTRLSAGQDKVADSRTSLGGAICRWHFLLDRGNP
jgi:hypothetical protein